MVQHSAISWTDHTFNPWIGCTKVSPACDRCYAEAWAKRYGRAQWGDAPRQRTSPATWRQPLKWNRETPGAFVFCASLADIFDNQVDPSWRADAFTVMRATPRLQWLLLTKRIANAVKLSEQAGGLPRNAALGATVVTQAEADRDAPKLIAAKQALGARFAFLSIEPMLERISLDQAIRAPGFDGLLIDWVIVGGESGARARPIHSNWVRALRDECNAAGVPFHFKQWGGPTPKAGGKTIDGREWCERPRMEQTA
ncbi:MAG: phage Gp37/Gp68 family protein [Hyphomonadaceae bacterium]|nr:phage Gp37/Gp68 family protein [Hyphomonadaceae bacterium]